MIERCRQTSLDGSIDYRRAEAAREEAAVSGYLVGGTREDVDSVFTALRQEIATSTATSRRAGGAGSAHPAPARRSEDEGVVRNGIGEEEYFTDGEIPVLFGRMLTIPEGCWRGHGGSYHGVARFSFKELCGGPLGSTDYSALAAEFSVVLLDDIPIMRFETRAYVQLNAMLRPTDELCL